MEAFLHTWLTNPDWWFCKDPKTDAFITETYGHLLNHETSDNFMASIVVYDQLPRHVLRNQPALHVVTYFLRKAISIITLNEHKVSFLTTPEWVFFHLPIRHTKEVCSIVRVMKRAWNRYETNKDTLLIRFLKATYENCPTDNQTSFVQMRNGNITCTFEKYNYILEHCPRESFLEEHRCELGAVQETCRDHVILSLSGGVDSMVCSYLLKRLFPSKRIVAVMINYSNRPTSDEEVAFVADWCASNDILFYVRTID